MTTQTHKWLPDEPSINLLISLATRISHIHLKKMKDQSFNIVPDIRELYAFLYASLPEVEQEPCGYLDKCLDFTLVSVDGKIPLYTHPQPKQSEQSTSEVEQEPAVYLVWHDGKFTYTKHPEEIVNAYEILPLYTHPPAIEPVQTLEELEQEIYENTQTFIPHNVMQWMLKRYRNHPPIVEQEPVGLFGCRDGEYKHILEPDDAGDYEELVKLYIHPQPKD